jgi:hypothetical protein
VALVLDWVLADLVGVFTPRAHLASLLGGESVEDMSGRLSEVSLVLLTLTFAALALRRARR